MTGVIYRSTSNVVLMSIRVQTLTDHARNLVARIRCRRLTCGGASRETQNPEDIAPSLNSLHGVQASVAIEATSAVSDETDCIPNSRVRLAVVQGPANPTSATQQTTRRTRRKMIGLCSPEGDRKCQREFDSNRGVWFVFKQSVSNET